MRKMHDPEPQHSIMFATWKSSSDVAMKEARQKSELANGYRKLKKQRGRFAEWVIGWWAFFWALVDALGETAARSLSSDGVAKLLLWVTYLCALVLVCYAIARTAL